MSDSNHLARGWTPQATRRKLAIRDFAAAMAVANRAFRQNGRTKPFGKYA
jgi:hypothetical protein